jgi:hypothetical protein
MSKSFAMSKNRRAHKNRLSSTKRKHELEEAKIVDSNGNAFKYYEKEKRIMDLNLKEVQRDSSSNKNSGITSPHFYKPQKKNKLFYIPRNNKLNKSLVKRNDNSTEMEWVQEDDSIRQYLRTEVSSPIYYPEFERTTSPGDRINMKILSTKHTTEETEEFTGKTPIDIFAKTTNKGFILKDLSMNEAKFQKSTALPFLQAPQTIGKEDSFQTWVEVSSHNKLSLETVKTNKASTKDDAPSVKDIKGESSISTLEKFQSQEMMEDSLNTCSWNKGSTAKKLLKNSTKKTVQKEDFLDALSTAINYFTYPHLKKSKPIKPRAEVYNLYKSPNKNQLDSKLIVMNKRNSGFINKKLIYNHSAVNKSMVENRNSFSEFRSPKRTLMTNLNKFKIDKVLKTENDVTSDSNAFNLAGTAGILFYRPSEGFNGRGAYRRQHEQRFRR